MITDGGNGSYCYDGEYMHHVFPRNIKIVETAGAGDCFTATFLGAYYKSNDIAFAMLMAQANVELVLGNIGTHDHTLTWDKLIKKLNEVKFKGWKRKLN